MMNKKKVEHVAIIMDGNGRWAEQRGLARLDGHREGAQAVERAVEAAKKMGVKYLTLYAFSTENWKRPKSEVAGLMNLLRSFLDEKLDEIHQKGIRIRAIGRLSQLPGRTRKKLQGAIEKTKNNSEGTLILALSYGGRAEIVDAAKEFAKAVKNGEMNVNDLTEETFERFLYAPDVPDPDLMIRTSGELRLSNFLLWELSYSEFYITDKLWPDFDEEEFKKAIDTYHSRDRRFGLRK